MCDHEILLLNAFQFIFGVGFPPFGHCFNPYSFGMETLLSLAPDQRGVTRFLAKIQVNEQDICWTLDLIQYLAQVARNSRKSQRKNSHGPVVSITLTLNVPKLFPPCAGGTFEPSMSHHLISYHNINQCSK